MEEKEKKKRKPWIEYILGLLSLIVIIGEAVLLIKSSKKIDSLEKENRELEKENSNLQGQVRATERENRNLARENSNISYQLGKEVAKKKT